MGCGVNAKSQEAADFITGRTDGGKGGRGGRDRLGDYVENMGRQREEEYEWLKKVIFLPLLPVFSLWFLFFIFVILVLGVLISCSYGQYMLYNIAVFSPKIKYWFIFGSQYSKCKHLNKPSLTVLPHVCTCAWPESVATSVRSACVKLQINVLSLVLQHMFSLQRVCVELEVDA